MNNQLRKGLEKLKNYYIKKIVNSGFHHTLENELHSFTLSELEMMYRTIPGNK